MTDEGRAALAASAPDEGARECVRCDASHDEDIHDHHYHSGQGPFIGEAHARPAAPVALDVDDRSFLRWCHERFAVVFHESPNLDWMQRTRRPLGAVR